ncbi:MAG: ABC transporter permease subunit, partial [Candidatus Bathyarchaeia archaeon]
MKTVKRAGKIVIDHLPPIGFFAAAFAFWEALVRITGVSEFLLPAPSTIVAVMANMQKAYYVPWAHHVRLTLFEIIVGFLLAVAVGILLAVFITYSTTMEKTLMPVIVFVEVLPKIAVAPLFLIWIGYGMEPKIAIAFLIAFFPMVVNTATGLRDVDPELIDLLRILKASKMQVF